MKQIWITLLFVCVLGFGTIFVTGVLFPGEVSEIAVSVPPGATVISQEKVTEGTFKIKETASEFASKAKDAKVTAVYSGGADPSVTYWRTEGAIFYFAVVHPRPSTMSPWASFISLNGNGNISYDGARFYFQPTAHPLYLLLAVIPLVIAWLVYSFRHP